MAALACRILSFRILDNVQLRIPLSVPVRTVQLFVAQLLVLDSKRKGLTARRDRVEGDSHFPWTSPMPLLAFPVTHSVPRLRLLQLMLN